MEDHDEGRQPGVLLEGRRRDPSAPPRPLQAAGPEALVTRQAVRALRSRRFSVLSLDVFDTALVRRCGAPEALFLWLARRLRARGLIDATPESFARVRERVEAEVWNREGSMDCDVTAADFHEELVRALRLDPRLTEKLVAEELALEEELLRPTRQAAELVEAAASAGLRVVFASDTYFSAAFIQRQLEAHGLWTPGSRCFASSDLRLSKESGALFDVIARELDVRPSEILHVGDNLACDVRSAERAGVGALWLPEGRLNRYEQLLHEARWETGGMTAALAGASRIARMDAAPEDARARALREVAAGVAAPLLVAYVLWLLQRARDLGLERLYFVARDGQVLSRLASILARRLDLAVDIRYLYASRRAVNLAGVFDTEPADLEWAFRQPRTAMLGSVLQRLGVQLSDVAGELARAGLEGCTESTPVTPEIRRVVEEAARSGGLRTLILERAESRRALVDDYLRQEGLLGDERVGVVDLGGIGSQARALHHLVTRGGGRTPRFFFLGLDDHPDPAFAAVTRSQPWLDEAECFLFDQPRRRGMRPFRGLNTAFQMFCAADHGTVLGYERRGGRVEPVLGRSGTDALRAWGLPVVRETLERFAAVVVLSDDLVDTRSALAPSVAAVVLEFMRRPTRTQARIWGAHPFEDAEVSSATQRPLATPYTWGGVLRAVVDGSVLRGTFPDTSWNAWPEASLATTRSRTLRQVLLAAERARRSLKASRSPWAGRARELVRRVR